jgi:tetratricopeptide (TPR) repeat protein
MIPPAVLRALVARSGGVPLYIEEVTKAILETGILAEREDHFELVGPISDRVVPMTTQDSLVARIDRLGPSKATAQIAAVLGREFRFDVLRAISAVDDGTLRRDVDRLVETGLARPIGDEGAGVYVFKHALIQEAAYETLLRRSRQEIHQRIAETLGEEFREVAASQPELVARHYEGAGLLEQAIPHWETAGLRALERAANHEAIAHLGSALGALQGLGNTPERRRKELQLQLRLAPACMAIHGWAAVEVEVACNRAREIAEELGEGEGLFGALWGLWTVHFVRGDLTRALAIAQRVLEMGLAANQPMLQVLGRHAVAYTSFFAGDLKGTRENAEKGLELFDLRQERDIVMFFQLSSSVALHNILALALWCLGCPREAAKEVETAEALAAVLDHRPSTAFCLSFSVYHAFHARHVARVRELADRLYRISVEEGFALWIPVAMLYGAWSRVILSESGDAAAELEKGLVQFHMTGTKATLVQIQALVAETRTLLGRSEEAMAAVVAGLEEVAARGERNFEAELYRIRGEILSSLGGAENVAEAEASIRCAMRIAKESGAKAFEFRALVSLTRLLGRLGRATEIRHAFEAICDGFDTGIDTPDLTEARALRREFEELRKYA